MHLGFQNPIRSLLQESHYFVCKNIFKMQDFIMRVDNAQKGMTRKLTILGVIFKYKYLLF